MLIFITNRKYLHFVPKQLVFVIDFILRKEMVNKDYIYKFFIFYLLNQLFSHCLIAKLISNGIVKAKNISKDVQYRLKLKVIKTILLKMKNSIFIVALMAVIYSSLAAVGFDPDSSDPGTYVLFFSTNRIFF